MNVYIFICNRFLAHTYIHKFFVRGGFINIKCVAIAGDKISFLQSESRHEGFRLTFFRYYHSTNYSTQTLTCADVMIRGKELTLRSKLKKWICQVARNPSGTIISIFSTTIHRGNKNSDSFVLNDVLSRSAFPGKSQCNGLGSVDSRNFQTSSLFSVTIFVLERFCNRKTIESNFSIHHSRRYRKTKKVAGDETLFSRTTKLLRWRYDRVLMKRRCWSNVTIIR